ncbi:MAG TPA: hypothetical protein VLV55_05405 [Rhizomicrobium sp.]|nr:hypothetical protein [Rhizomicrobium sp.]
MRQIHRWTSIVLVLMIVSYPFIMKMKGLPQWLLYSPLLPFIVLALTGLYLFFLPYARRWRARAARMA